MNVVQALDDPHVFGPVIRSPATWGAWRGFLKALFGLPSRLHPDARLVCLYLVDYPLAGSVQGPM